MINIDFDDEIFFLNEVRLWLEKELRRAARIPRPARDHAIQPVAEPEVLSTNGLVVNLSEMIVLIDGKPQSTDPVVCLYLQALVELGEWNNHKQIKAKMIEIADEYRALRDVRAVFIDS